MSCSQHQFSPHHRHVKFHHGFQIGKILNFFRVYTFTNKLDSNVKILVTLCLAAAVAVVSARPRFLAIPLEDVEFVNRPVYIPHHRITRRAGE